MAATAPRLAQTARLVSSVTCQTLRPGARTASLPNHLHLHSYDPYEYCDTDRPAQPARRPP